MKHYNLEVETVFGNSISDTYSDDFEAVNDLLDMVRDGAEANNGLLEKVQYGIITEVETHGGMIAGEKIIREYKVYTTYAPDTDLTFIMLDRRTGEDLETSVIGFYHGSGGEHELDAYIGKLSAYHAGFYKEKYIHNWDS